MPRDGEERWHPRSQPGFTVLTRGPQKGCPWESALGHRARAFTCRGRASDLRAPLPSEASVAASLVCSSSLVRGQIVKLISSQGERALLRPPVLPGRCQTEGPPRGHTGVWPGEALFFNCAFS